MIERVKTLINIDILLTAVIVLLGFLLAFLLQQVWKDVADLKMHMSESDVRIATVKQTEQDHYSEIVNRLDEIRQWLRDSRSQSSR